VLLPVMMARMDESGDNDDDSIFSSNEEEGGSEDKESGYVQPLLFEHFWQ